MVYRRWHLLPPEIPRFAESKETRIYLRNFVGNFPTLSNFPISVCAEYGLAKRKEMLDSEIYLLAGEKKPRVCLSVSIVSSIPAAVRVIIYLLIGRLA